MSNRNVFTYFIIGAVVGILLGTLLNNPVLGLAIGLGIAALGYFLAQRGGGISLSGGSRNRNAYQQLLAKAGGDKGLADRLVAYERKRNPNGSADEWAADALERWKRDRT